MKKFKPIYKDSINKIKKDIKTELGMSKISKPKKFNYIGEYK
jgi:hypothetical protein